MVIESTNQSTEDIQLVGLNADGITWTTLKSVTGLTGEKHTILVNSATHHKTYGLIINKTNSSIGRSTVEIGDLRLFTESFSIDGGNTTITQLRLGSTLEVTGNVEVGTANLFVDTTTSRVGIGTNAPAHTLDVHGSANVGTITTTDINVTGNLTVLGTTTTLDTVNLRVKDPIIEIGKDNTASPVVDLGLILTRPATTSNVAIIFDETTDTLEIGYTQSNASDTDIIMRAAAEPLSVNVNGTISGNVRGLQL